MVMLVSSRRRRLRPHDTPVPAPVNRRRCRHLIKAKTVAISVVVVSLLLSEVEAAVRLGVLQGRGNVAREMLSNRVHSNL